MVSRKTVRCPPNQSKPTSMTTDAPLATKSLPADERDHQPDCSPLRTDSARVAVRVTFNPEVADLRYRRRLSMPLETLSHIPRSILKKRSSVCVESAREELDASPVAEEPWNSEAARMKAGVTLPCSDEFVRALVEMQAESSLVRREP